MKFPDSLLVKLTEQLTGLPVADVALILKLKSSQKNNYSVGPKITDRNGTVEFSKKDCEEAIRRAQEMFVMDYTGDLLSCQPVAEIGLHSPEQIGQMLRQFNSAPEFWGKAFPEPDRLFTALQTVRNVEFCPAQISVNEGELLESSEVEIYLARN